jgi:hypothetical protein
MFSNHQRTLRSSTGAQPLTEFNHTKHWLLLEEEEVILEFALEIASCGWPLEKERIKAHVNNVRATLPQLH